MDEVAILESLVAAVEGGVVGYILYQKRLISKKKAMLIEKDKELQAKTDEIQDLKGQISLKDLEIKMLDKK